MHSPVEINPESIYQERFGQTIAYRRSVWRILVADVFSRFIAPDAAVLDLGCGYGEFINAVQSRTRFAIDRNPGAGNQLNSEIKFLLQDSAIPWQGIEDNSLDIVFTSNFLEHLPDKAAVAGTLREAHRCLKSGGRLIAMGPNAKYLGGRYWDFWDHQIPLTENSLIEALRALGFTIDQCNDRFLPYTMSSGRKYPLMFIKLYLALPFLWKLWGRQFLIVARKL